MLFIGLLLEIEVLAIYETSLWCLNKELLNKNEHCTYCIIVPLPTKM